MASRTGMQARGLPSRGPFKKQFGLWSRMVFEKGDIESLINF